MNKKLINIITCGVIVMSAFLNAYIYHDVNPFGPNHIAWDLPSIVMAVLLVIAGPLAIRWSYLEAKAHQK